MSRLGWQQQFHLECVTCNGTAVKGFCVMRQYDYVSSLLSYDGRRPSGGWMRESRRPAVKGTAGPSSASRLSAPASCRTSATPQCSL